MKFVLILCMMSSFSVMANDSLEREYIGATSNGDICRINIRDSRGSASFHYREDGKSKSCAFSYDLYSLTTDRDDGRLYSIISSKSGFKTCRMQVYFENREKVSRIKMGIKSIFSATKYEECHLSLDPL